VTAGTAPGPARQGLRVLDEALKLLDALQAQPSAATDGPPGPAHAGGECRLCPVCRGLAALREVNPEAVARMGRALADLAAAFAEFAGPVEEPGSTPPAEPPPPRAVRVQRIDVTD
jgi:hypothetical protein